MWREWQDRRNQIRATLASLQHQQKAHITNLDVALQMIVQVGMVYNSLTALCCGLFSQLCLINQAHPD
jgi:hypothetical protein